MRGDNPETKAKEYTVLKKNKASNRNLAISVAVCVISVVVMIVVLLNPKSSTGEFVPPEFDVSAQIGTPDVPDNLGWQELDAKAYKVSVCGKVIPNGKEADVWLTNPQSNTVWLKLRVLDENENILGETGIVKNGEFVQSVTFDSVPKKGKKIVLKIMAYQPDTYYSEGAITLDTTINGG